MDEGGVAFTIELHLPGISVFIPACFCSLLMEKDDKRSKYDITEKVVKRQPGDGHCVIYSVQESLLHSAVTAVPSTAGLLEMMKFEILNNKDYYEEFCMNADVSRDLERYVREKVYNKDTLDLAVNALANCLGVELRIYELSEDEQHYQLYTVPIPPARREDPPRVVLDILKTGEHYDALIDSPTLDQGRNEQFNILWGMTETKYMIHVLKCKTVMLKHFFKSLVSMFCSSRTKRTRTKRTTSCFFSYIFFVQLW